MDKTSSFERVVGDLSKTTEETILQNRGERFDDQIFEELEGKEREKNSDELQMISLANEATNEIRKQYDLDNFDIPPKNVHIITEETWPLLKSRGVAFYKSMIQGIAMKEQSAKIVFMHKIFHEMLHFKSYNALQITTNENAELKEYRLGLTITTRDGKKLYFSNLNEAVTEELTKRFITSALDYPFFNEEAEQTKNTIRRHPWAISNNHPLFNSETFYAVAKNEEKQSGTTGTPRVIAKISAEGFTYKPERKIMNTLIDKIFKINLDKFKDREEIFEIFAKGMMTGNILTIGKLIDRTFGDGTFRKIGELDNDIQAQEKLVNSL